MNSGYRIAFEIDHLPKMPNTLLGAHWSIRSGHARTWKRLVWAAIGSNKPKTPLHKARLTLTRFSSVEPDHDGLVGSFKSAIDSLVACGVLVNDKPENIGVPLVGWVKCSPKKGKIKIEIEEVNAQ